MQWREPKNSMTVISSVLIGVELLSKKLNYTDLESARRALPPSEELHIPKYCSTCELLCDESSKVSSDSNYEVIATTESKLFNHE